MIGKWIRPNELAVTLVGDEKFLAPIAASLGLETQVVTPSSY
jgi:hypothetical protein